MLHLPHAPVAQQRSLEVGDHVEIYGYGNVVEARFNGLNGIICAIIPVDRGVVQCAVKIDMPGCTGENEIRIDYAHLRAYEPLDSHGEDDQVAAYWKHTG